ncbi:hypothetical protein QBC35DRAFT_75253 [Podospora australis]|uniref:Uncharacterized protein n=1 Tax=Podospora australis TaxID=1536484 RepID=A0AAN6X0E9_9PEZI|nr:hypothetical protein QBC35DRAFT_75253 [Podospora australis]
MRLPTEAVLQAMALSSRGLDAVNPGTTNSLAHHITAIPNFNVTQFRAAAVIDSNRAFINFNVVYDKHLPAIYCSHFGDNFADGLTNVEKVICGRSENSPPTDHDIWFSLTSLPSKAQPDAEPGSFGLRIVRQIDELTFDQAMHTIKEADVPWVGPDDMRHQVYEGPQNFTAPAARIKRGN